MKAYQKHEIALLKYDLRGKLQEAANEIKMSRQTVSHVLNGTYYSHEVLQKLMEYRDKCEANKQKKEEKTA